MANMNGLSLDVSGLRERLPQQPASPLQAESEDAAREAVLQLNNAEEQEAEKAKRGRRTFGRTPDGQVFTVPQTHDMVSQLFSPTQPKNISDIIVVLVLCLHALTLYLLPVPLRKPVFAAIYVFWRASYNGGVGYLLHMQSNHQMLVKWAKNSRIFEHPSTGKNPYPWLYRILKREMETKIPTDYNFDEAPLEYNTWLVFRRLVDLILMCDFTSYCLFAIACGNRPVGENLAMGALRWAAGIGLVLFNLWVKLDAHRVVKDYAWYWGDFFYLIDQELTFDGVFEMAPHPMYSVGYAGFYGISLMAASYNVLFISIFAHAAQFTFLALVESPHIEKTYNQPQPRRRRSETGDSEERSLTSDAGHVNDYPPLASAAQPSPVHNVLGLGSFDVHRITDISVLLLQFYLFVLTALTPSTPLFQTFFVTNAVAWRLWYSLGIGFLLDRQSKKQYWTRHFVKYGESTEEAWRQWKGLYHVSMTMFYASFIAAAWKMYTLPPDWEYKMALLRHVLGIALILLHIWTVTSIYQSLGEFGWFYGDFFFAHAPKLTYNGIYRYLNNPERFLGLAGVWGVAIITWSKSIFALACLSHVLALAFIHFIERPHMQKLYGESLRQDSGLSKSIKRSLPKPIRNWGGSVDRVIDQTVDLVEDLIDSAKPKIGARIDTILKDYASLFKNYNARITITKVAPDLAGYDPKDYSIEVEGTPSPARTERQKASGREGEAGRMPAIRRSEFQTLMFEYGAPIKVCWRAPSHHSNKDWIGLYMVVDNASRDVTRVSSQGRWIATTRGVYDSARADQGILISDSRVKDVQQAHCCGEMVFEGDKLWWTSGVFEFRYHHDGKHNVMAISLPFEIRLGKFEEDDFDYDANGQMRSAVEETLLPIVRNCFDRDPDIAPDTVEDVFGSLVEKDGKYAKRVVFAVHQIFGVEFAPEVVQADGSVKNLAWRICTAKKVLAPYTMSTAKGRTTPTGVAD